MTSSQAAICLQSKMHGVTRCSCSLLKKTEIFLNMTLHSCPSNCEPRFAPCGLCTLAFVVWGVFNLCTKCKLHVANSITNSSGNSNQMQPGMGRGCVTGNKLVLSERWPIPAAKQTAVRRLTQLSRETWKQNTADYLCRFNSSNPALRRAPVRHK